MRKTWTEAQSYCRENFVDLATIETPEEWAQIQNIMANLNTRLWIGLHDDVKGWKWSMDNSYLYGDDRNTQFGNWFDFRVDAGIEHCVVINGSVLDDAECSELKKSVCYDGECALLYTIFKVLNESFNSFQLNCVND